MELAEAGMIWLLISNLRCSGVRERSELTPVHLRLRTRGLAVDLARVDIIRKVVETIMSTLI